MSNNNEFKLGDTIYYALTCFNQLLTGEFLGQCPLNKDCYLLNSNSCTKTGVFKTKEEAEEYLNEIRNKRSKF